MNKLIVSILFLLIHVILFSQITIDQTDMPQAGDTIRLSSAIDFGNLNYEETGSNFVWDFSELTFFSQSVDTFVSVQQTPWVYQLVFFLSANLASPGQDFDQLPGFQVTDYFNYFKNSSSEYKSVGFGVTLNSIPIPNKFDDPDIIYRFPLSTGDVDSSLSNYALDIPGLGYYGGWKKRVNYVDGWGDLTTPYGTFETIRIKSDIIQYDSLYIDSLGFGFPVLRNFTEYKWLAKDFGLPLCTVTDDGLLPMIEYIDSVRALITNVHSSEIINPNLTVSPNPFEHNFSVNIALSKDAHVIISLYNLNGVKVFEIYNRFIRQTTNIHTITFNDLNISKGIYLLHVKINDEIKVRKIVKN
ncbi:MAG: T9SS type A sorting domain-containing protein [Bacteroidales bacterium]|nr:T9SS type A sorting domain-containing protein [Bacteroidales bacterium]